MSDPKTMLDIINLNLLEEGWAKDRIIELENKVSRLNEKLRLISEVVHSVEVSNGR